MRVGVVNEKFARDYFENKNPVGRFFYFGDTDVPRPQDRVEIVGVCKDAKYDRLRVAAPPTVWPKDSFSNKQLCLDWWGVLARRTGGRVYGTSHSPLGGTAKRPN